MKKRVSILGSTGSIGVQALDVVRNGDFTVTALASGSNVKLLEQQAREFDPEYIAVYDEKAAKELKTLLSDTAIRIEGGEEAVITAAGFDENDIVLNSIVGIAGLKPTITAIEAKKTIALANKETLVAGGDLVMQAAKENGVSILPVDSEHSAIFQCLQGVPNGALSKILLTASGGPFYGKKREELTTISPEAALKHPNWSMGRKITIDSATLMNKGLEVIEAVHLFGVTPSQIEVLVHRQSIVHSAVELLDGAVIAQLGSPDMRIPIQYAITYPSRFPCPSPKISLSEIANLTFDKPDFTTFACLKICIEAITEGGLKPAAANGANEIAVSLFLDGKISFLQIAELIAKAVSLQPKVESYTLKDVFAADLAAREAVLSSL